MTFLQFKNKLLTELCADFGSDYQIEVLTIPKNNKVTLQGLSIHKKDLHISPTIYLEPFYEAFKQGTSFDEILKEIKLTYYHTIPPVDFDINFFTEFESVKPHICMKLIHYQRNEELLKEIPHIRFLDLAVVFYYLFPIAMCENATILIYNHHLSLWNINSEELFQIAKENSPKLLPYYLDDIFSVMDGLDGYAPSPSSSNIYVLTNSDKLFGASAILYPQLLSLIAHRMECDFVIIPSSIHEVLLVPYTENTPPAHYEEMISEVNDTQLAREEILSDHAYFFERATDSISCYTASHTLSPKPSMSNHIS